MSGLWDWASPSCHDEPLAGAPACRLILVPCHLVNEPVLTVFDLATTLRHRAGHRAKLLMKRIHRPPIEAGAGMRELIAAVVHVMRDRALSVQMSRVYSTAHNSYDGCM